MGGLEGGGRHRQSKHVLIEPGLFLTGGSLETRRLAAGVTGVPSKSSLCLRRGNCALRGMRSAGAESGTEGAVVGPALIELTAGI